MAERYTITNAPDAAIIPRWLILNKKLTANGRLLAQAILLHVQSGDGMPARDDLAADFEVETRTIDRWLDELRGAHILETFRDGRRCLFSLLQPRKRGESTDRSTVDRSIDSRQIDRLTESIDRSTVDRSIDSGSHHSIGVKQGRVDRSIDSHTVVGVVGDHDSTIKKPTTTNRGSLQTPLGCWLKQAGMNAARQFDNPALDYWTYRRFVEEKRAAGWEWRQIVSTLREAPLDPDPRTALLDQVDEALADDRPLAAPRGLTAGEAQERFERLHSQRRKP